MNNKLPIEVKKDNFLTRFFKFLTSIFKKKDEVCSIQENNEVDNGITFEGNNLKEIKSESMSKRNPQKVIEEIVQIIEKRPDILEKLDIEKLEVIDMYYKRKIAECKRKLKRI